MLQTARLLHTRCAISQLVDPEFLRCISGKGTALIVKGHFQYLRSVRGDERISVSMVPLLWR